MWMSFWTSLSSMRLTGNARPVCHDLGDVFVIDLFFQHLLAVLNLRELASVLLQFFVQFDQLPVADFRGPGKVTFPLGVHASSVL